MKKFLVYGITLCISILIASIAFISSLRSLRLLAEINSTATVLTYKNENSIFNDFKIEGNTVTMHCDIVITNNSSKDLSFKMVAHFWDDFKNGLITTPYLYGIDNAVDHDVFFIPAGQSKEYNVNFKGIHGDIKEKQNRLPPTSIEFMIVE